MGFSFLTTVCGTQFIPGQEVQRFAFSESRAIWQKQKSEYEILIIDNVSTQYDITQHRNVS